MKQFLIKISYTVLPLWILTVGLVAYYYSVILPNMQGDLGILGKIPSKFFYDSPKDNYMKNCRVDDIEMKDAKIVCRVDIATCGDSFSQQGVYGYQNYLVTNGFRVGNFPTSDNPFQTASSLLINNEIDTNKVRTLIVETVERYLVNRLVKLDLSKKEYALHKRNNGSTVSENRLIETKNYLFFLLGLEKDNPVKKFDLKETMFSGSHGKELYVYYEDMDEPLNIPDSSKQLLQKNVEILFAEAKKRGIHLIILVCPDKYDLYQDCILGDSFVRKSINEDFRKIVSENKDIVIAKEILLPYIRKGMKDLYHFDDTHWSYKSAKIVADTLSSLCKVFP